MRELGIDLPQTKEYFSTVTSRDSWVHVKLEAPTPEEWLELVSLAVRRCYISDGALRALRDDRGLTVQRAVAMQIPDPGAVMSGDYAEILAALYLAAISEETDVHLAKKWRCKNDRTKAAPKSDVVEISLPYWPNATTEDRIHCAEVKAKATKSNRSPVVDALTDSQRDQNGRLDKTLVWLDECSYRFDLGILDTNHLNRFIEAVKHPQSVRDSMPSQWWTLGSLMTNLQS